jgi:hypothetical protein
VLKLNTQIWVIERLQKVKLAQKVKKITYINKVKRKIQELY